MEASFRKDIAKKRQASMRAAAADDPDNPFFNMSLPPFLSGLMGDDGDFPECSIPPRIENDLQDPVHWVTMPEQSHRSDEILDNFANLTDTKTKRLFG
jgi:hypothetical protein